MSRITDESIFVLASSCAAAGAAASASTSVMPSVVVLVIRDHRVKRIFPQLLAPLEKRQLDHEGHAPPLAAELLAQPQGGAHCPAGRQQVVHREHALRRLDRVL